MKAILEFNLPEDSTEHLLAIHGADYSIVCWELDEIIRSWLKHGHKFMTIKEALESVRNELRQSLEDKYISLDI